MDAGEAFPSFPGPLVGGSLWVEREEAEGRQQELGEIPIPQWPVVPETLPTFVDYLENKLNRAQCQLPAHEKAEVPTDVGVLSRQSQPLKVKYDVELGEQDPNQLLVGLPLSGTSPGVYFLQRKVAQELEYDVVDIATECEMAPYRCQPEEERRRCRIGGHGTRTPYRRERLDGVERLYDQEDSGCFCLCICRGWIHSMNGSSPPRTKREGNIELGCRMQQRQGHALSFNGDVDMDFLIARNPCPIERGSGSVDSKRG